MTPPDPRPVLALGALVRLLERAGEGRWLAWARDHLDTARAIGIDASVLDAYAGPGSFNDLILDPVNGHALGRHEVPWANRLLAVLGERIFQLALERTDERFEAGWPQPPDPPVEGWRCAACGHRELSPYEIEWWSARVLVPAHVADATLEADPAMVDTVVEGRLLGAAEGRADVVRRAGASGIRVADREGPMRPCPSCRSDDTEVARWVLAGGGLAIVDDGENRR